MRNLPIQIYCIYADIDGFGNSKHRSYDVLLHFKNRSFISKNMYMVMCGSLLALCL